MPPILTCLVGKKLSDRTEDHWSLRESAAELVSIICTRYRDAYHSLIPRVSKTLLKAFLDPQKSLATHYGAIIGLSTLGQEVVRVLIIPNVVAYCNQIMPDLEGSSADSLRVLEAKKCYDSLLVSIPYSRPEMKECY